MSDVLKSFRTYLLTKSAVTDEVSTRIYPETLPQNPTLPAATLNVISDVKHHHMAGASIVAKARVQVDIFATSRVAAKDAAEGFRNAADGYRGAAGDDFFELCHLDSEQSDTDSPIASESLPRYRIIQDWIIGVQESTPTL